MPVTLKTNSFKYRDDPNDNWSAALVQAVAPLAPAYEKIDELASEVGIVITGARPSQAVSAGQYVIVRDSTISGVTDGLYTAKNALATGTDVTAADLNTKITNGAVNDLKDSLADLAYTTAGLTFNNCSHVAGGYVKIGNLVVICMQINIPNSGVTVTVSGFPSYSGNKTLVFASDGGVHKEISISPSGTFGMTPTQYVTGTTIYNACYIAA